MKTPQWTVKVARKYNPDRTVIAYGKTAEQAQEDAKSSLRETYGIWDAEKVEVIGEKPCFSRE